MVLLGFCFLLSGIMFSGAAHGLEITSGGPRTTERASGDSVKLACVFTLAPEDSGHLDIEWSLMASDSQNLDKVIILYSGGRVYEHYYPAMKGRMHFSSADPEEGDASVNLTRLETSDTGTYQCKVKKAPGIGSRKMFLSVMVRPSKTQCFKEGPSKEGKDLVLRCVSSEGTSPLQYTWEKTSDGLLLPASALQDPISGTMSIRNVTASASGSYRCTVNNRVGTDECVLHLRVTPSLNMAGIIAGAVIGALLALILIPIILFCCCRARNKNKYEKEIAFEIREDSPPPRCRVSMARSVTSAGSQHSSLCSVSPSNLHAPRPQYDKVPTAELAPRPQNDKVPTAELAPRPQYDKVPTAELAPRPQYDKIPTEEPAILARPGGSSLSRVGAVPVTSPAQTRDGSVV